MYTGLWERLADATRRFPGLRWDYRILRCHQCRATEIDGGDWSQNRVPVRVPEIVGRSPGFLARMWRSEEHPSWFLTISNDACQCHIGSCNGTVTVLRFLEAQLQSNVNMKEKLHDDSLRWGHGRARISRGICIPANTGRPSLRVLRSLKLSP